MATLPVEEVVLTEEVLERFEEKFQNRKWDTFELPDGPLPTLERFARHGGPDLSDLRFDNDDPNSREKPRSRSLGVGPRSQDNELPNAREKPPSGPVGGDGPDGQSGPVGPSSNHFEGILTSYNIQPLGEVLSEQQEATHDLDRMEAWVRNTLSETEVPHTPQSRQAFLRFRPLGASHLPGNVFDDFSQYFCLRRFTDDKPSVYTRQNLKFNPEASMTDGNTEPAVAQFCDGADVTYLVQDLHRQLAALVDPSTDSEGPIAPNFFLETQTPSEPPAILRNKALEVGAYGARAIYTLRGHADEDSLRRRDRNEMLAFTATFEDGNLKLYGHSVGSARAGRQQFRMRLIASFAVDSDVETMRRASKLLWGLREEAMRLRDEAVEDANRRHQEDEVSRDSIFIGYDVLNDDDDQAP